MTSDITITVDNHSIPCSKDNDDEIIIIETDITLKEKLLGVSDVEEDSEA